MVTTSVFFALNLVVSIQALALRILLSLSRALVTIVSLLVFQGSMT